MIPGECVGVSGHTCEDCGTHMELQVCRSAAGYYLGYYCNCGPYSRETGYFGSSREATAALIAVQITKED